MGDRLLINYWQKKKVLIVFYCFKGWTAEVCWCKEGKENAILPVHNDDHKEYCVYQWRVETM